MCDIVTFQTVYRICNTVDFFSGIKNLFSRFKINGIIAVLWFFLFMSNLAKQQILSRNVSNVKQLIGSMGDMDRTSVFFSYSRPPPPRSQINKYDRLWPRKIYSRTPLFRSPKGNGKKFEIAGLRNNRGSVKRKGKSKGNRSSFEIAGTSN